MGSACCPRSSRPTDASLPSTGSSGASSPASAVLSRRYDLLPPVPPHFVAFAWRYLTRPLVLFAPRRTSAPPRPGVVNPVSPAGSSRRSRQDLPGSWGTPSVRSPCSVDAGRTAGTRPVRCRSAAPGIRTARAPTKGLSALNSMAFGLAVTLRSAGHPRPTQDSLPAAGQALPDGLSTRRVPMSGFGVSTTSRPPLPSLPGAIGSTEASASLPARVGVVGPKRAK